MKDYPVEVMDLIQTSHLALGFLVAKVGLSDSVVVALAKALKGCGSDATYVRGICEASEKDTHGK